MGCDFTCGLVHPAVPVTVWHLSDSALLFSCILSLASCLALFCLLIGQIIYLLSTNRSNAYLQHTEWLSHSKPVSLVALLKGSSLATPVAMGTLLCCHTGCCFFRSYLICFAIQIKSVLPQQQLNKWTSRACTTTTHSVSATRSQFMNSCWEKQSREGMTERVPLPEALTTSQLAEQRRNAHLQIPWVRFQFHCSLVTPWV